MGNRCSKAGLKACATGRGTQSAQSPQRILSFAVLAAFAFIVVPILAQQADRARTEALPRRAGERLQALQREAERLASQESTLLNDLRKLEVARQVKGEELKQPDAEAARVGGVLPAAAERMEAL